MILRPLVFFLAAVSLSASVLIGCAGVDTGNGAPAYFHMALTVGDAAPVDKGGAPFTVESASVYVRHVDLYLPQGVSCGAANALGLPAGVVCDTDTLRFAGPFRIDLLTGTATPPLPEPTSLRPSSASTERAQSVGEPS